MKDSARTWPLTVPRDSRPYLEGSGNLISVRENRAKFKDDHHWPRSSFRQGTQLTTGEFNMVGEIMVSLVIVSGLYLAIRSYLRGPRPSPQAPGSKVSTSSTRQAT